MRVLSGCCAEPKLGYNKTCRFQGGRKEIKFHLTLNMKFVEHEAK